VRLGGDPDAVSREAREPSMSIGVDEVSFFHLVAGVLVEEGKVPSKSCWRFPSLLEEFDFWPGAMLKMEGQPMGGGWVMRLGTWWLERRGRARVMELGGG